MHENQRRGLHWGFLRGRLIPDHGLFSPYESQQGAANGQDFWGVFQGCTQSFGRLDAGSLASFTLLDKASAAMDLGILPIQYLFLHEGRMYGLEKLALP